MRVLSERAAYVSSATVIPDGDGRVPDAVGGGSAAAARSDVERVDGAITSNLAIVPAANGRISAFLSNATQLVLDIFGYFAP